MLSVGGTEPRLTWVVLQVRQSGLRALKSILRYRRAVGVWSKIHDDGLGRVSLDGSASKTFTPGDMEKLAHGRAALEKLLIRYGCNPDQILHGDAIISHPGGTASVGRVVDVNLETKIKNLYCCDTSVMPAAPGRPPTLTLVCLAKRLAERLLKIV